MPATITMGKGSNSSSSSSRFNSSNRTARSGAAQPTSFSRSKKDHATDLRLALGFPTAHRLEQWQQSDWAQSDHSSSEMMSNYDMEVDESDNATFYVKVYMEGIPIGRKLDLLAHGGYFALIATLNYMFGTAIHWSEEDGAQVDGCHVLTYEDGEGDWLMVGDVPWEMFLSSVKRLKVTRIG